MANAHYPSNATTSQILLRSSYQGVFGLIRVEDSLSFRNIEGKFRSAQKEIGIRNRQIARNLQEETVKLTYSRLLRPSVSTDRLRKALSDPGEIRFGATGKTGDAQYGFGVYDTSRGGSLDRSRAKYWRIIEYGSATAAPNYLGALVDRQGIPLFGRWGGTISGFSAGRPIGGPPWVAAGGKLRPFSAQRRETMMATGAKAAIRGTPVIARNAMDGAWRKYGSDKAAEKLLSAIRDELGLRR